MKKGTILTLVVVGPSSTSRTYASSTGRASSATAPRYQAGQADRRRHPRLQHPVVSPGPRPRHRAVQPLMCLPSPATHHPPLHRLLPAPLLFRKQGGRIVQSPDV
jgi:hypothetical protein